METIYNRGKSQLRIHDSSLLAFAQSIVNVIEVPSYMSVTEVEYVKKEAKRILDAIRPDMDGKKLMGKATSEIGEILHDSENIRKNSPVIHFFDELRPDEDVFIDLVIWAIGAFYRTKIQPAKKIKAVPKMQEVWKTDGNTSVHIPVKALKDRLAVDFIPGTGMAFTGVWLTGPAVKVAEITL